jgi:hypothetical protein
VSNPNSPITITKKPKKKKGFVSNLLMLLTVGEKKRGKKRKTEGSKRHLKILEICDQTLIKKE